MRKGNLGRLNYTFRLYNYHYDIKSVTGTSFWTRVVNIHHVSYLQRFIYRLFYNTGVSITVILCFTNTAFRKKKQTKKNNNNTIVLHAQVLCVRV